MTHSVYQRYIRAIQSEPDETSAYIQLDKNELLPKGQQQADVENVRSEQKKDHSRAQEARHQADIQVNTDIRGIFEKISLIVGCVEFA
jgi:hypothetical protein